jgi:hypothetical protein
VALKVTEKVHPNDKVLKVTEGMCGGGVEVIIAVGNIDLELIALDLARLR